MSRVMISCGEPSGDLYAGALARQLRALQPATEVFGFGGGRLAAAGADLVGDFRGLTVTGVTEVIGQLPRTYAMYRRLVAAARARKPDVAVLIDFPDFNFTLGKALHRQGVPVVYYISPQVWAWRSGRLRTMKRFVDRVLVIFPFEVAIYERAGIAVDFVGHPLVELIPPVPPRARFLGGLGLREHAPTVALLPGSRPNEVRAILPVLAEACPLIAVRVPGVQFVLARAPGLDEHEFAPAVRVREQGLPLAMVEEQTDAALAAADVVLTASGTATVQAALHDCPMVIVYRMHPLTYRLGIRFVRVDTYGMVNLIAGRRVFTELIQDQFTPEATAVECLTLLKDADRRAQAKQELRAVREKLGGAGASRRAAAAVLGVAGTGPIPAVLAAPTPAGDGSQGENTPA